MDEHTVERTGNIQQRETESEPPASNTRITGTMMQESTPKHTTIVLFCHPRNVSNLVESFTEQIAHAAGSLPMKIRWSGTSSVLHQGVLLLEWTGIIPPAALRDFVIDQEIFDVVVYEQDQEQRTQMQTTRSLFTK